MSPAIISITNREKSINTPILRDLILNTFMHATIVDAASISLTSHTPSVTQYIVIKNNPMISDKISNSLIRPYSG